MIHIEQDPVLSEVELTTLAVIYKAVGWPARSPERLRQVYAHSLSLFVARENDHGLIGLVRAIGDPFFRIFICDLIIHPDFQGKGYGKSLLECITSHHKQVKGISLIAAPGKEGFYEKQGWTQGMICFDWLGSAGYREKENT